MTYKRPMGNAQEKKKEEKKKKPIGKWGS
jgi:hypothetical protein